VKVICVGQNYRAHLQEMKGDEVAVPTLFAKLAQTIIGDGDAIRLPAESTHVDAEAELAIVIGKSVRRVSRERALDAVRGYVCANDVSARDVQYETTQFFRGKNWETFCPVGPADPVPVSELGDASGLRVQQLLNGEVLQDGNTRDLIFDVPFLVAHCSVALTLEPGDLILTGTPSGVGYARDPKLPLRPGDVVEVRVEGIGSLTNPCVAD
jgi:2-keto-4-pentenoate hydratase/2-oxohepta-3-ene-1,7-dioic acid hydratase in catechol pathway